MRVHTELTYFRRSALKTIIKALNGIGKPLASKELGG